MILLRASFIVLALLPGTLSASLVFSRGELVFTGVNSDNPDEFAFFTTRPIDAGAEIRFTDSGWLAAGGLGATNPTWPREIIGSAVLFTGMWLAAARLFHQAACTEDRESAAA